MQHRKRTKVTAALLALCMLVSLLPVTAFGLDPQSVELGKGSTIDGTGYHVTSVKKLLHCTRHFRASYYHQ